MDRVQQELISTDDVISTDDDNGEAKYAPLPAQNVEPAAELKPGMDLETTDEVDIRFTETEDGRIIGQVPPMMGKTAYNFELQSMDWGLFQDIEAMQKVPDEERMNSMLDFLIRYVVGGPRAVPLKHTRTIFEAITKYAGYAMDDSKN